MLSESCKNSRPAAPPRVAASAAAPPPAAIRPAPQSTVVVVWLAANNNNSSRAAAVVRRHIINIIQMLRVKFWLFFQNYSFFTFKGPRTKKKVFSNI